MAIKHIIQGGFGDVTKIVTGGYTLGEAVVVAVAQAHDPGERFEAHPPGDAFEAHDPGATYAAAA